MAIVAILLLVIGVILAAMGLAVRFAGSSPILAGIDLSNVDDMAALNRWAGNKLLLIPPVSLAFGAMGLARPILSLVGLVAVAIVGFSVFIWLMIGAERFRAAR